MRASSNTGNISLQLVAQHCCFASCRALLPVLPPPRATCRATNFSVASCSNMLHEVELGSTFGNKSWCCLRGVVIRATKLCNLHTMLHDTLQGNVARITGPWASHGNENVIKQKVYWAKQYPCTSVKSVHFFAVLCKTTTWNGLGLCRLLKGNDDG